MSRARVRSRDWARPNYIGDAFSKPVGTVLGPIDIPQMKAVVKVLAHTDADPSLLASQKDTIREQLKSQKATERAKLFEAGLVEALTRDGKIKVHKDVVSRLQASYKG